MKIDVRELLHRLAGILELLVGFFMLGALGAGLIGLVYQISFPTLITYPEVFQKYLNIAATIVIGVEFVKMLCNHTLDAVIEVMLLAIARQMIVEHTTPQQNLIAVLSVGVLFLVRKYLFIPKLDRIAHHPLGKLPNLFFWRKNRQQAHSDAEMIVDELLPEEHDYLNRR